MSNRIVSIGRSWWKVTYSQYFCPLSWSFFCREWNALTCQGSEACALPGTWSRAWCWPSSQGSTSSTTSWTKPSVTPRSPASSTMMSCSVSEDLVGWVTFNWMVFCSWFSVCLCYVLEKKSFGIYNVFYGTAVPETAPQAILPYRQTGLFFYILKCSFILVISIEQETCIFPLIEIPSVNAVKLHTR